MSQPERPDLETIAKGKGVPMLKALARYALAVELDLGVKQAQVDLCNETIDHIERERDEAREELASLKECPPECAAVDAVETLERDITALRRRVREVVGSVEWNAYDECGTGARAESLCILCNESRIDGHAPACPLAALLAECAE